MADIINVATEAHLDVVRRLMRAFVEWHRQRHVEDLLLIEQYFDAMAFEAELATLPGLYALPKGRLLLAFHNSQPAGCVALRGLDAQVCEMKRMFVYPHVQGKGIGRSMAEVLIHEARASGYRSMRLDTSFRQVEAQGLYRSLGFKEIAAYSSLAPALTNWLVFMELPL